MIEIKNPNTTNLESNGLLQTSKGVLLKWNREDKYYKSGALHYGIFSKLHPVVECICSRIREKLGLNGVEYRRLALIKSKGCEDFEEQEILCCVSDDFLKTDETLINFAKHYKNYNQKLTYNKLLEDFKDFEEEINQTLIFDFIVNNIDRHFNNFEYIINRKRKYCPIFDNSLSLYSDLNLEEIKVINKNEYAKKRYDRNKPFECKHNSQIKSIKNLLYINLNNTNEEFIEIIEEYKDYLGEETVNVIIKLLEERLNYV